MSNKLIWDLESIFTGGSESVELAQFIDDLKSDIEDADTRGLPAMLSSESQNAWADLIETYYDLASRLRHVAAFVTCLVSQDVNDTPALQIQAGLEAMSSRLSSLSTRMTAYAAEQNDEDWDALTALPSLKSIAFSLNEGRDEARNKMNANLESLAGELATDGYHAWHRLYNITVGAKQIDFRVNGSERPMTLYQLQNTFDGHPDRDVRQRAFTAFEEGWQELSTVCAEALNHQAGYRLTLYRHRGWDSILQEPLQNNRITRQTLDAMWDVIARRSDKLCDYFDAKAKLLGLNKLTWYDVGAPIGEQARTFSYDAAADFIVDNFEGFDPEIAKFCRMAIDKRWVEAEDRPAKRAGGYCTSLPLLGESRIFMTFDGSYGSMSTLAHELGHAYHGWTMRDLPFGARRYTMSVAETASTFNQLVVVDASLKEAQSDAEKLSLLNQKLDEAVSFLMNIRCRFDFERAFFDQRVKGHLNVDQLSETMLKAQQTAYQQGLAEDGYHPLFWASKLHFYITRAPFYNFPYTFGYLFSNGVYQQALAEGAGFGKQYISLLRDTGSMDTETLAKTHLGIDLTQPDFWEAAVDRILADVDTFVTLADKMN
ncbi:MAG: M3 family oligoendopeptidase [Chloroflexota bacterium]